MSDLGKIIPLSSEEKELYSKLDFKYFLGQNIIRENISPENVVLINKGYNKTIDAIKNARRINKAQFHLFIEGYVRKMHSGGMLGSHFNLSEAREFTILRFEEYGENWAYFEVWAKRERYLRIRKLIWKRIVEFGAILGFVLAAFNIYKAFNPGK
jgi:hypothetical protein